MFAPRYFPPRYFPARYYPVAGAPLAVGATVPAIFGHRLGNFRLGYRSAALARLRTTRVRILLNDVLVSSSSSSPRTRIAGLTIRDVLNDAPNTCNLTISGSAPQVTQRLRISVNSDAPRLLFTGALDTVDLTYEGTPVHTVWPCTAIDDTARANRLRPFGTWTNVSATLIAQALVVLYAPGFTSTHVEAALPAVSVTFDGSEGMDGCLRQLAKLIGGSFKWEDLDLWLYITDPSGDPPDDLDMTPGRFLDDPPIQVRVDASQVRTRLYGRGHGEELLSDVLVGETILPIRNVVMFNAFGGQAISDSQVVTYTGTQAGGGGTLVGPGAAPSLAATLLAALGSGIESGAHSYAATFVTGSGESLPGPVSAITVGAPFPSPTPAPALTGSAPGTGVYMTTWTYFFAITFTTAAGETLIGPWVGYHPLSDNSAIIVYNIPLGPPGVTGRKIYRATAAEFMLIATLANNTATVYYSTGSETEGAQRPTSDTAGTRSRVDLSAIPTGVAAVTQRKIYRTAAGLSQLKLLTTIANNTTTVYADSTADASLGANVPTTDTSGLTQPPGQVNAGSTSLLTAGWPFQTSGWALSGDQVVRYTGVTGNTLTGIPASGPGSITTTVLYGSQLLPAPALTGVTGVTIAMARGVMLHLWVQRNDLAAQAYMAALEGSGTGVYEHRISDERRGEASLTALCDAELVLYSRPLVTVTYATRDTKTKSGKPIVVNLTTPPISETLTIQECQIDQIDVAPGLAPRFTVVASSTRQTLEAVLQRLIGEAA